MSTVPGISGSAATGSYCPSSIITSFVRKKDLLFSVSPDRWW